MRPKKCRAPSCKEWFKPWNSMQKACSPDCALEVARINESKKQRKKDRERKQQLKSLSRLCSEAQVEVNRYIRARDRNKPCISCGNPNVTDAGHLFHAGSKYRTSRLRFDPRVIVGQCGDCNRFSGGGNQAAFIEGYRQRYGQQALDEVYELKRQADAKELAPLDKDEVREIKRYYRNLANEMERSE